MKETFYRLSQMLTGVGELDSSLAQGLLQRLQETEESSELERLLAQFVLIEESTTDRASLIREDIMRDDRLRELVKMIVLLWYTGDLKADDTDLSPATEEQYFGGVLWKVIRAHPPALSGGYFGHWTYPPDNS